MNEPYCLWLASVPESVAVLRREITAIASRCGLTGSALTDVTLAISEAATNAVMHGSASPAARLAMSVAFARGGMQVTISDDGPDRRGSRAPRPGGGYGLSIIRSITDGNVVVTTTDRGTAVEMDFACPASAHDGAPVRPERPAAA